MRLDSNPEHKANNRKVVTFYLAEFEPEGSPADEDKQVNKPSRTGYERHGWMLSEGEFGTGGKGKGLEIQKKGSGDEKGETHEGN